MKTFLLFFGLFVIGTIIYALFAEVIIPKINASLEIDENVDRKTRKKIMNLQGWVILLSFILILTVIRRCS